VFRNNTAFGSTVVVTERSTYYSVYSNSLPDHAKNTGVTAQTNTLRIPKTVTRATTTTTLLGRWA
jgi:hypothetical protein